MTGLMIVPKSLISQHICMLDEQIYIHFKGENLLYYQIKYHQN